MNKLFVFVLLTGFSACFAGRINLFPGFCNVDADCGTNKCCLLSKICSPKLQANFPCNLQSIHKCGCADGLECKVTANITFLGKVYFYRQCRAADETVVPEEIDVDKDGESRRKKRWLLRSCDSHAECGKERCCSSLHGKCTPLLPKYSLCKTEGCCAAGLECQVSFNVELDDHVPGNFKFPLLPLKQCLPKKV